MSLAGALIVKSMLSPRLTLVSIDIGFVKTMEWRSKQSIIHPKVFTSSNLSMTERAQSKIQNQCNDLIQREKQPTKSPHPPHPIIGCDRPHTVPFFSRKNNFITVSSNQQLAINHSATVCLSTIHKMQSCCCCSWWLKQSISNAGHITVNVMLRKNCFWGKSLSMLQ